MSGSVEFVLRYWPVISGVGMALAAVWARSDILRLFYRAFTDRSKMACDTAELRRRFRVEVERADFWEKRCDDLDKQFRVGLEELSRIKHALRTYKQLIQDLLVDREALREWGYQLMHELERRGVPVPAPPHMRTESVNILNPTNEEPRIFYES